MSYRYVTASAPGSVMLFGEHAVLHRKQALVCAVSDRIHVALKPREDKLICVSSPGIGTHTVSLSEFRVEEPFTFVLAAIKPFLPLVPVGFDLEIHSDFLSTIGLGSSAAVTVAVTKVLVEALNISLLIPELVSKARAAVRSVQGMGSGADVAASIHGGVICYRMDPLAVKIIQARPELTLVYSGAKVPTPTVIDLVAQRQRAEPARYQRIYEAIEECTQRAHQALENADWGALGELMNEHHQWQVELGVSTPLLEELVADLRRQPGVYGAKISGSGLGDCVIALGKPAETFPLTEAQRQAGVKQIPIRISVEGCCATCTLN
jgi:mevalonate kinase